MSLGLLWISDKKIGSIVGDLEVIEALVSKLNIEVLSIELSSHLATLFVIYMLQLYVAGAV
jgi:hypothetical protein